MAFTRRTFIKTLVVAAGAATVPMLSGCNDYDDDHRPLAEVPRSPFFPHSVMSGDPRESSVVLWTRIADAIAGDLDVTLQVSTDASFTTVVLEETLSALAGNDHCLKVRVTALQSHTHYYYRFSYGGDLSPVGRTKTAAAASSDVPVKYAFASCQDYVGRYFNLYLRLLEEDMDDLDFVVHLGDYIYETSGDPDFQQSSEDRQLMFDDIAGALALKSDSGATFYAAQSLDNYRQVYKTYRTDAVLQKVQEKFPVVAIWDDHEFSDDSWQNNSTLYGVQTGEGSQQRKQNAEQAWLEYMPIDQDSVAGMVSGETGRVDVASSKLSQGTDTGTGIGALTSGISIYRNLRFGKHLELILGDYRTFRPDHLIPEDAFPGTVITPVGPATKPELAYVVVSTLSPATQGALQQIVAGMYSALYSATDAPIEDAIQSAVEKAASVVAGNLSAAYLNAVIDGAVASSALDAATAAALQADIAANIQPLDGLSYFALGKTALSGELGSRYLVVKSSYDALSQQIVPVAAQNPYGEAQWAWMEGVLDSSEATWRVLGSSVSLTPMVLGLDSALPESIKASLPTMLQNDFYLNVDQWDGFQGFRDQVLLPKMGATANSPNGVLTIAGDIHSNWVSDHGEGRYCFTTSSISSATFMEILEGQTASLVNDLVAADPTQDAATLQAGVNQLLVLGETIIERSDERVKLGKLNEHGLGIMYVDAVAAEVTFVQMLPESAGLDLVKTSYYDAAQIATDRMFERKYRVENNALVRLA